MTNDKTLEFLIRRACEMQIEACMTADTERLEILQEFIKRTAYLKILFNSFRSAMGKIKGKGGVASRLKTSRYGIYNRIEWYGLIPADFKKPDMSFAELLMKSDPLRQLVEQVNTWANEHDLVRD